MKKRLLSFVLIVLLCGSLFGCTKAPSGETAQSASVLQMQQAVKYTLYIGLNDKDTYTQLIPDEEAEQRVCDIALKYVDGFTVLPAKGVYKDDKGVTTHESSLVLEVTSATDEQMSAMMKEIIHALNQNSVLIEKQTVDYDFYDVTDG